MTAPTQTTAPSTRPRDRLLDMLRAISIVRVVAIHIMRFCLFSWWPAPTFVAPGMPVVFFVSGGLARSSLARRADGARRTAADYWRRTYRRLLLPYWAFYGVVAFVAVVGDLVHDTDGWSVRTRGLLFGVTGLAVPRPSPVVSEYIGHLWFMSVFLVMAALAPALVRWYERSKVGMLGGVFAVFVMVQYVEMVGGVRIPYEVDALSMFGVMYCLGFLYTDGTLGTWPARIFVALAGVATVATFLYDGIDPGAANISEPKHLMVGIGWLALGLAAGGAIARFGERHRTLLALITRRTFTAYLWGWPTTRLAAQFAHRYLDRGWDYRVGMALLSIALLALAVWMFGGVEDVSAGRRRSPAMTEPDPVAPVALAAART